jgi:ribosomal protein S18 acetylase RimI-like enzyme
MVKSKALKILRKKLDKANQSVEPWLKQNLKDHPSVRQLHAMQLTLSYSNTLSDDSCCCCNVHPNTTMKSEWQQPIDNSSLLIKECWNLFEANMGDWYRNSSWGLDQEAKIDEWKHEDARFLFVQRQQQRTEGRVQENENSIGLVAFVHFRICYDDDDDDEGDPERVVLYLYEIQVAESVRRRGVGQILMHLLEDICRDAAQLDTLLLTVFRNNTMAMQFYREKLKYQIDTSSPHPDDVDADYEILCKKL